MIHLRIISASNLPSADKNGYSDPYVLIYPCNFGYSSLPINKTKTIKKTLNPNWDENLTIPFVSFDSTIRLVFMDADKLSDDDRLGSADIYPSITNFYRHDAQIQTARISVDPKYKTTGDSTVQYSIIPTFSSFDFKKKKDPKRIYVYLAFDSFQPSSQDIIRLHVYGVNRNGTIIDPINDNHTHGEYEASHFSPMGLVQVYSFDKTDFWDTALIDEQYFFIIYTKGFLGKVTLTFVYGPRNNLKEKVSEKFHIFNNQYSLSSNSKDQCLMPFQAALKFSKKDVKIESLPIPSNLQNIKISNENEYLPKLEEMMYGLGQLLCPSGKSIHIRFDGSNTKKYSINELFQKSHIKSSPSRINIAIGWDTYTDLDLLVFPLTIDDRLLDPIGSKSKKADSSQSIKAKGDSRKGTKYGDDEIITVDLNNVDCKVKCLVIAVSSHELVLFNSINGGYLRIFDCDTEKEVLYTKFEGKENYKTCLVWGVLGRIEDSWFVWPCSRFVNGPTAKAAHDSINELVKNGLIDQFWHVQ
ncbi:Tricalbin-2 [Tritrichomonas musculus]|uniref:Tricalbin-2 n=1 Tax=Tritrichomonas musculus TaxID=1915356 RepID=A0ABR2KZS8_9EUKA